MKRVITPTRMRTVEAALIAAGQADGLTLMERAAQGISDALSGLTGRGALFLCGSGNNGGDGYAAARLYARKGRQAWVWALSDPEALRGDARVNWRRCVGAGIPVTHITALPPNPPAGCGALCDALLGTGMDRPLAGLYADAVRWMNGSGLPVLAVDMPTGDDDMMVRAALTVTFHRMKPAHLLYPGRACAGRVQVQAIGLPDTDDDAEDFLVLEPTDIPRLLPPRAPDANKGNAGRAVLLAGSPGMAGAAALSANAALRGGAGLVTVCADGPVMAAVQHLAPCATCVPRAGFTGALAGANAVAAGPGLGADAGALLTALADANIKQVWDADALNWLAAHPLRLSPFSVITPHPGEAARLLGTDTASIVRSPVDAAQALNDRYGAVALVKGASTVITGTQKRAINTSGTPGMATGGSGDVLTGLIAALLAQGLAPFEAAMLGAYLHGLAGEEAAAKRGVRSMTAWDLMEALHLA